MLMPEERPIRGTHTSDPCERTTRAALVELAKVLRVVAAWTWRQSPQVSVPRLPPVMRLVAS
jgi:hypothetical protein